MDAESNTALVDDDKVIAVVDTFDSHECSGLLSDIHCTDTLSTSVGDTVDRLLLNLAVNLNLGVKRGALAVTTLAEHHYVIDGIGLHANHAYHLIILVIKSHTADTSRHTAHLTYF